MAYTFIICMIHHLILVGIMRLIGLTVGRSAEVTARGIQSRMGWLLVLLPIAVIPLFLAFGFLALGDPDPGDQACSLLVFGLAGAFVLASAYFLTFRLVLEETTLRTSSLVTPDRQINLQEAFTVEWDDWNRTMYVRQGKTRIAINWMMSGHEKLFDMVWLLDRKFKKGGGASDSGKLSN